MSEQDNQAVDATSSNEEAVVIEDTTSDAQEETQEAPQPKTYSEQEFKTVWARALKAETALKKNTPISNNAPSDEVIEEKILLSQGMSEDLLGELKALAKVRGKSLISTQNDPIFTALKEAREAESKAQKAKLGASKGSGQVKKAKDFKSSGVTDEEHKAMWRESQGR